MTGVIDPATRAALVAIPVLHLGSGMWSMRGSAAVRRLQRDLRRAGESPGPLDGRFGPRTRAALVAWQTQRGVRRTGVAGPRIQRAVAQPRTFDLRRRHATPGNRLARRAPAHPITPLRLPAPAPAAEPAAPSTVNPPGLPGEWILIALGLIGAGVAIRGYVRTRHGAQQGLSSAISRGGDRP